MPTFPQSPYHSVRRVFPSMAGRLAFQTVPSRIVSSLSLLPACAIRRPVCIVLRALRRRSGYPALCQAADSIAHRLGGLLILRPRGPRSGPGYSVPVRHHLIDPIRPTRRHIATSPHGGLYAMPSLCGSASATRVVPGFRCSFRPDMPPSLTPGSSIVVSVQCTDVDIGLRHGPKGSALPMFPQSVSRGARFSGLLWLTTATACQVAGPPVRT